MTDHNTVRGVEPAVKAGKKAGVEVIPAVELDVSFAGQGFHLLGYFIDHTCREFMEIEASIFELEMKAFPVMIEKLQEIGFDISWDEFKKTLKADQTPTEEDLANLIFSKPANQEKEMVKPYLPGGERSGMPQFYFYRDFLAPGKRGFTKREYISMEDAAALIRRHGGVPILAHPGGNIHGDYDLLPRMTEAGAAGFEAFSSYHTSEENRIFLDYCVENGLLYTCGSDYHGRMKKEITLGIHHCTEDQEEIYRKPEIRSLSRS